ncbi:MAG TPA: DUF4031 domain-containing protein [Ktedonobacteraceae bacterium]|jgi:hypothetical protein|nr:DUF4031 domain-containing protein [Ktedonobacteraceae bacterium]
MTVYVDELMSCLPTRKWPYKKACHMRADTEDELHTFAAKIGLKREWYQNHHRNPVMWHYDLNAGKRKEAIQKGARAITWREMAAMITGKPPYNPDLETKEKGGTP